MQRPLYLSHVIRHFHLCHLEKCNSLYLCMAGEGVCELRYRTGTDLLCVITSLSVWGEISCNIILKYMLDVWEMLSECHNFGFLSDTDSTSSKQKCQLIKIAELKIERSRLSLSVCAPHPLCLSFSFRKTTQIPLILQVVISSLLIDVSC